MRILIFCLFFVGCSSGSDSGFWSTGSNIPADHTDSSYNKPAFARGQIYYDAWKYDEHGFLLPYDDTGFKDQGDALLFNSIATAIDCINGRGVPLWDNIKGLQQANGSFKRHPANSTAMSRDQLTGFLYLGAVAKYKGCDLDDYSDSLLSLAHYLNGRNWLVSGSTYLIDRSSLKALFNLYDLDGGFLDMDSSVSNMALTTASADFFFHQKFICKTTNFTLACVISDEWESFGVHLAFLKTIIYSIENELVNASTHNKTQIESFWKNLARVGDSSGFNNWLYVAGYRRFNLNNPTYNDANQFLMIAFPATITGDQNGVLGWGCTAYIWQRVPFEKCGGSLIYSGLDLLHLLAIQKL